MTRTAIILPCRELVDGAVATVVLVLSGDDPRSAATIERARANGLEVAPSARFTGDSASDFVTNVLNTAGAECIIALPPVPELWDDPQQPPIVW